MYRNRGSLATIGRRSAVVQLGRPGHRVKLRGYLAWWLWGVAHIYFLIGFRSRLAVATTWAWNYLTFQRGMRLITGPDPEAALGLDTVASPAAPSSRQDGSAPLVRRSDSLSP